MRLSRRCPFALMALTAVMALSLPASRAEPQNLTVLKEEIATYIDSGAYERAIADVAVSAQAWLEQRAAHRKPGERLLVVFDLDETLISNLPSMRPLDFGYVPDAWEAWVRAGRAPAIAPILGVTSAARRLGFAIVVLTGREERYRAATEKNLRAIGCDAYAALILKPDADTATTGAFKLAERRRLVAEGGTIVANIGDQASDFEGGESERDFKLPDPFYLTK